MCDIQQRRPPPPSTAPPPPPTGADAAGATCHQEQAALDGGTIVSSVGKGPQADGDGGANIDAEFREGGKEQSVIDKYTGFRKAVASMGLERAWDMAPLVRVSEVSILSSSNDVLLLPMLTKVARCRRSMWVILIVYKSWHVCLLAVKNVYLYLPLINTPGALDICSKVVCCKVFDW